MAAYLIDYENVGSAGLDGLADLNRNDEVIIFYSAHADTVKVDNVMQIYSSRARITFIKAETGTPNALDFQLLVYLFCSLKRNQEYVIVSRDNGYDVAIAMGKTMGVGNITRLPAINGIDKPAETKPARKRRSTKAAAKAAEPAAKPVESAAKPAAKSAESAAKPAEPAAKPAEPAAEAKTAAPQLQAAEAPREKA